MPNDLELWKRAVVHIEGVGHSVKPSPGEWARHVQEAQQGKMPTREVVEELLTKLGSRADVRSRGTALFVRLEQRRYLITAWHVIRDKVPEPPDDVSAGSQPERTYPVILRLRSLSELNATTINKAPRYLSGSGEAVLGNNLLAVDPDADVAVLALDHHPFDGAEFAEDLEGCGAIPVDFGLLGGAPTAEGAEITAIGFPGQVSELGRLPLVGVPKYFAAGHFSLPAATWGRVSMCDERLPFFWCDLTAYPGQSGGPVIEGGRVVGILTGQASIVVEWNGEPLDDFAQRIPFARAARAGIARELIKSLHARPPKFRL